MFNAVLQQEAFSNESGRTFKRWLIALPLVFVATLAQPYFLGADLTVPVYNNTEQDCRLPVAEGSDAGFLPLALS